MAVCDHILITVISQKKKKKKKKKKEKGISGYISSVALGNIQRGKTKARVKDRQYESFTGPAPKEKERTGDGDPVLQRSVHSQYSVTHEEGQTKLKSFHNNREFKMKDFQTTIQLVHTSSS